MTDSNHALPIDPAALSLAMRGIAKECQYFLSTYWAGQLARAGKPVDPLGVISTLQALSAQWLAHPTVLMRAQTDVWTQSWQLWSQFNQRLWGLPATSPVAAMAPGDRRFRDPHWQDHPFFDFVKQTYLVAASALFKLTAETPGLDTKTAQKAAFYVRQFADALAPSNFIATNPEVLRVTVETQGQNLVRGLRHLIEDFDPAEGQLRPRMVAGDGFEVGRNLATAPGKVVFQNELIQLLQYAPTTAVVKRRPLLIVPPWINKFYILDLQPRNSFIRWAVAEGHTVFVISWVNPGAELRDKDFEDYAVGGPLAALDAIRAITSEAEVNLIGYCIGGTLLGATLAHLRALGDSRVSSATFFTTLLDFSDVGDLSVFIDEAQITHLEQVMQAQGFLEGRAMSNAFNLIRANDLIWSFVVNNYLLGRAPAAFDLLYWNADSTRMPARLHSTYLRRMYLENALREPGGITLLGEPVDLGRIDVPACFVSALDDHIAPWKTTFSGAGLLGGEVSFLLGKAGHVAGIINPPGPKAYDHYVGPAVDTLTAEEWLSNATLRSGSWWESWSKWIDRFSGGEVPARTLGEGLEEAPGSYVRQRDTT